MRERTIEQRLITETRKLDGLAMKFVSPGFDGVPDRIVLLPGGRMGFVELKAPGQKLRPLQVVMEQIICENGIGWDWTGGGGKIVGKSA